MKRSVLIFAAILITNVVFGQFTPQENEIIDGITKEMCACMEAEKMELKNYQAFNAALIHCMNYDDSSYKPLIDSIYIQNDDFDFLVKIPEAISKRIRKNCQLVKEFYSNNGIPDLANHIQYEITGLTLAVDSMDLMLDFYTNVFNVNFVNLNIMDAKLHQGQWGHLLLLLCPAEIAEIEAEVNRHQFNLDVNDLDKAVEMVLANGGSVKKESKAVPGMRVITVFDPDGNSIVLREMK